LTDPILTKACLIPLACHAASLQVLIILLNIIFGIIIDTFSELRMTRKERETDTNEFCFICGLGKLTFAKPNGGPGFEHHIKKEHCLWNYLKFIMHLKLQERGQDDGLEQHIRGMLEDGDLNWLPEGRGGVTIAETS
jgi:hypothetical protein